MPCSRLELVGWALRTLIDIYFGPLMAVAKQINIFRCLVALYFFLLNVLAFCFFDGMVILYICVQNIDFLIRLHKQWQQLQQLRLFTKHTPISIKYFKKQWRLPVRRAWCVPFECIELWEHIHLGQIFINLKFVVLIQRVAAWEESLISNQWKIALAAVVTALTDLWQRR